MIPSPFASAVGPPAFSIALFVGSSMVVDDKQCLAESNRQLLGAANLKNRHIQLMEEWNRRLARLRNKTGMSQAKAAKSLGIAPASVAQWETGRSRPDISRLPALARLYNVDIRELCGDDLPLPPADPERAHLSSLIDQLTPANIAAMILIAEGLIKSQAPPPHPFAAGDNQRGHGTGCDNVVPMQSRVVTAA